MLLAARYAFLRSTPARIAAEARAWLVALLIVYLGSQLFVGGALLFQFVFSPDQSSVTVRACMTLQLMAALESAFVFIQNILPMAPILITALALRANPIASFCLKLAAVLLSAFCSSFLFDHFMEPYPFLAYGDTTPYHYGLTPALYLAASALHAIIFLIAMARSGRSADGPESRGAIPIPAR